MKPQQHAEATPVMLDRTIGFLYGIFMQVGMIIGSGIFISPSGVLRHAGSVGWALMVWLACGFLSLLGALSYAELGTTIRQSGSHYIYLRETLGTLPAFLFLWVEFIIVRPSVMAVVFLSMGQYSLEALYSPCAVPRIAVKLLAMVSISFVVWVNTWSSTLSLRVQSCLSVSKLAALASIIGVGIAHVARASRLPRRADRIFRERLRHRRQPPGRSAAGVLLGDVRLFGVGFPELCHGGGEAPRTHDSGGDLRLAGHRDRRLPPRQRRLLRRAHPVADPRLRCRGPDIRRKHPGQCVLDHRASLRGPVLPRRQHGLVLYITQGVHRAGCSPCRVFMVASRQHHWPSIFRMIHVRRRTPCPAMLLLVSLNAERATALPLVPRRWRARGGLITSAAVSSRVRRCHHERGSVIVRVAVSSRVWRSHHERGGVITSAAVSSRVRRCHHECGGVITSAAVSSRVRRCHHECSGVITSLAVSSRAWRCHRACSGVIACVSVSSCVYRCHRACIGRSTGRGTPSPHLSLSLLQER
ncbi:large neutral amino acids transporter small subunit 2-like isoform X2 [Petromyzon marinus]|uniref:large neutral amino acids transporter small subunit 2-like isoform X2 n=1 Tax=Petromyzon marinus TaxID=7757 RepID=UPI003F728D4F